MVPQWRYFPSSRIGKRRVFQDQKFPRPLRDNNEVILYGWADPKILSNPSIISAKHLRQYKECLELTLGGSQDSDYILRVASEDKCICF